VGSEVECFQRLHFYFNFGWFLQWGDKQGSCFVALSPPKNCFCTVFSFVTFNFRVTIVSVLFPSFLCQFCKRDLSNLLPTAIKATFTVTFISFLLIVPNSLGGQALSHLVYQKNLEKNWFMKKVWEKRGLSESKTVENEKSESFWPAMHLGRLPVVAQVKYEDAEWTSSVIPQIYIWQLGNKTLCGQSSEGWKISPIPSTP